MLFILKEKVFGLIEYEDIVNLQFDGEFGR